MISTVPQFFHSSNSECGRYAVQGNHSPQFPSTVANCGGKNAATQHPTVENAKGRSLWKQLAVNTPAFQSNSPAAPRTNTRATSQFECGPQIQGSA